MNHTICVVNYNFKTFVCDYSVTLTSTPMTYFTTITVLCLFRLNLANYHSMFYNKYIYIMYYITHNLTFYVLFHFSDSRPLSFLFVTITLLDTFVTCDINFSYFNVFYSIKCFVYLN